MNGIDRRNLLAVSGLTLALAACGKADDTNQAVENGGQHTGEVDAKTSGVKLGILTPPKNYGFDPTLGHPGMGEIWKPGGDPTSRQPAKFQSQVPFDPAYVAVFCVALDFSDLAEVKIVVRSVHFDAVRPGANDWAANEENIVKAINFMNGNGSVNAGFFRSDHRSFRELKFSGPHHVIVYIKNKGISFSRNKPIIVGDTLLENSGLNAEKNATFFDCEHKENVKGISSGSLNDCSSELIYLKNYFHHHDDKNGIQEIKDKTAYWHSLNFIATLKAKDDALLVIPVIFDPDTGNMGGGGGYP